MITNTPFFSNLPWETGALWDPGVVALKPVETQLHSEHAFAMPTAVWGTRNLVAKLAANKALTTSFNHRAPNALTRVSRELVRIHPTSSQSLLIPFSLRFFGLRVHSCSEDL